MSEIQAGSTYTFKNVKSGTVVDLSGTDNKSIIGWEDNKTQNQKWIFEQQENSWAIRSGDGHFIGVEGEPQDGSPLVSIDSPYIWNISRDERDESHFRIFAPNTEFNFDLSDHGNPTPGTRVQLWSKNPGKGQTWILEPVQ